MIFEIENSFCSENGNVDGYVDGNGYSYGSGSGSGNDSGWGPND